MKKMITLLALIMTCQLAFCQTFNDFFDKYKDVEGIEYQEVTKDMLKLAMGQADADTKAALERIESIRTMTVASPTEELINAMDADTDQLQVRYQKLVEQSEDGQAILILGDGEDDDQFEALFVLQASAEGINAILMTGRISMSELEKFGGMAGN